MKLNEWKTYRTRFLIQAKQLNSALSFTDHLGRKHCGRKGDYLVESSDGVLSITPRQIFEDIYVAMSAAEDSGSKEGTNQTTRTIGHEDTNWDALADDRPEYEKYTRQKPPASYLRVHPTDPHHIRRKSPQSIRDRRAGASRLGLM